MADKGPPKQTDQPTSQSGAADKGDKSTKPEESHDPNERTTEDDKGKSDYGVYKAHGTHLSPDTPLLPGMKPIKKNLTPKPKAAPQLSTPVSPDHPSPAKAQQAPPSQLNRQSLDTASTAKGKQEPPQQSVRASLNTTSDAKAEQAPHSEPTRQSSVHPPVKAQQTLPQKEPPGPPTPLQKVQPVKFLLETSSISSSSSGVEHTYAPYIPEIPAEKPPVANLSIESDASIALTTPSLPPVRRHSVYADFEDEILSRMSDEFSGFVKKPSIPAKELTLQKQTHAPDDELLFTLTAKEEIVFRRSLADMRWEEEMSTAKERDHAASSRDTSDSEDRAAAAILWERVEHKKKRLVIPEIRVNDRRVSIGYLNPSPDAMQNTLEDYKSVIEQGMANDSDSDEDEAAQKLWEFLDEAGSIKKKAETDEEKQAANRAKLWRRRLTVVLLLQLLMKGRKLFILLCEILSPAIFCGFIIAGMSFCTSIYHQSLIPSQDPGYGPFDKVTAQTLMTSVCSNADCNAEGSTRHYFIVYAPSNNFTDDLMFRALKHMGLGNAVIGGEDDSDLEAKILTDTKSKLIGVSNPEEVRKICTEHWNNSTHKPGEEESEDEPATADFDGGLHDAMRYPFGIIFTMEDNMIGNQRMKRILENQDVPYHMSYTIRTFYPEIANTVEGFPFREQTASGGVDHNRSRLTPYAIHSGFIGLQMALDFAYADKIVEKADELDPFMQIGDIKVSRRSFYDAFLTQPAIKQFEYPAYHDKNLKTRIWLCISFSIVLSFLLVDVFCAQETVSEQNKGGIEMLKIHGMTTSMRWISNLAIIIILRALPTLVMALIIHFMISVESVSKRESVIFLWIFIWMYACTCTCFNLFIITSCAIKKPELAGLFVVCVNILTLLMPLLTFREWNHFPLMVNIILCFFLPPWNMANGIYYYLKFELYDDGLQWYDFPVLIDTTNHKILALPLCCLMFLYSTMFYVVFTIYMDHILPREFSPRSHWLFFLNSLSQRNLNSKATRPIPRDQKPTVYEAGPKDCVYGPRFRGVTVNDAANKLIVLDNISLDIYEGEVTCIVGQIGSGKSDFLNVIAGVNVPAAGFVDVKGIRVHERHDVINKHVSLCPQKQLLIESLSVEEHIIVCCMLHGVSYAQAKKQAAFLLKMFELMQMSRHSYKGLTNNDSRKLMLAMALSKSPSVLLMDNPVDELDSDSRFQFWKLLQELKLMRSIIVTCTTLEEAQLYADRIAILSRGKLVCYGSPQFIRLAYGIGNVMTLKMVDGYTPDVAALQQVIHAELRGARTTHLDTKGVSLQTGAVKLLMPYGKFYASLLEKLDENLEQYGISKIHMGPPSLWALFDRIAANPGIEQSLALREIRMLRRTEATAADKMYDTSVEPSIPVISKHKNTWLKISKALYLKKWWFYKQEYAVFIIAYIPQMLMVISMALTSHLFVFTKPESLSRIVSSVMYSNQTILYRSMDNEHMRTGWEEAFAHIVAEDDKITKVEVLDHAIDLEQILETGKAHTLTHYKRQSIVAFAKDKDGFVGYYSSNSFHSAALAGHLIMQAFLFVLSPDRNKTYGTTLVTYPFEQYRGYPVGSTQSVSATIFGIYFSVILTLMSAPMLRMVLIERATSFKTVQRMTGVTSSIYWFSHGFADFILYLVITIVSWLIIVGLDRIFSRKLEGRDEIGALLFVMGIWLCWTALPYMYLLGCWLPKMSVGYGYSILFHFLFGIIPKICTFQFMRLSTDDWALVIRYILYIFPQYSLTSACVQFFHIVGGEDWCDALDDSDTGECRMYENSKALLTNNSVEDFETQPELVSEDARIFLGEAFDFHERFRTCCNKYCSHTGTCQKWDKFFDWPDETETQIPLLQHDCIALLLNGLGFWILLILYEKDVIQSVLSYLSRKVCGHLEKSVALKDTNVSNEPEDVQKEHQKVDYMVEIEADVDSEVYLVQDVTKFHPWVKSLDHIYFSVPVNLVTGLLGLPKSGKSTILAILTAQLSPSAGFVYKNNDLLDASTAGKLMTDVGYCAQKSCVISSLTGAQMLTIMGRLRGLSKRECQVHVLLWLELFDLMEVANKKCGKYRKGQERRLSCAMALIGDTKTVIFDEPTAFMDNYERYIFWNVISRLHNNSPRTVLFASINADEVQNQSNKALLMESGSLIAVGELTEIFQNNNQGLTLAIRYGVPAYKSYTELQNRAKIDKLKDHVVQYLSPVALIDEQACILIYHLKDPALKLSRVYAVMEGAKVKFTTLIKDFQVFEASLDDIILQFHNARVRRQDDQTIMEDAQKRKE